ncbi:MAG: hypothetical protein HW403_1113, partial [Dehalococcoidia bacterium]|nr:hypothetical protein [Dehalococcoidia bacterium]
MIKYLLFKLASIVVPWLPYPVAHAVSAFAGELAYLLAAGPRRAVTSNLRHILGSSASPAETARIARGVFRTQTLNYLDMFRIPKLSPDQIRRAVTVVGIEHYYEARARGKGIIVATAHYGNMDLLVQASLTVDTQVLVLVEPLEPPALFQLVAGLRS